MGILKSFFSLFSSSGKTKKRRTRRVKSKMFKTRKHPVMHKQRGG